MKPKQDREPKKRIIFFVAAVMVGVIGTAAGIYIYLGRQYRTVFFPNTTINGLDASGKTVEQVKEMIQSGMEGYVLTLEGRDGGNWQVAGEAIGLHSEYDGALEALLAGQNPLEWGFHYREGTTETISAMIAFNRELLEDKLRNLGCMDEAKARGPENAYLSEYIEGSGYEIIPEVQGNRLIFDRVLEGAQEAIINLCPVLSLEELDAYEKPEITSESPELTAKADTWNRYVGVTINFQFGDAVEHLDGDIIHTWLSENEYGNIVLDEEQVSAYVKDLADRYNTAYKEKQLKTSYGPTVTISRGNYGWRINQTAEAAALSEIIRSGTGQTREPIYSQMAASHGNYDYGDTYVEINLSAQHLFFYKDGTLLVESDFVSGNEAKGWSTPSGAYPLTYKQRNATLKGEGYTTPVSYWMPFNGGIGMHDAGWRSSFGGTIYQTGGSHGCINLPPEKAKIIYENISSGMPVLCYHLEGTQTGSAAPAPPEIAAGQETLPPASVEDGTSGHVTEDQPDGVPDQRDSAGGLTEQTEAQGASETQMEESPETSGGSETPESPAAPDENSSPGAGPLLPPDPSAGGDTEKYGPGGAPAKPDTGAVEGPGM